jgi:hypothetical protein
MGIWELKNFIGDWADADDAETVRVARHRHDQHFESCKCLRSFDE